MAKKISDLMRINDRYLRSVQLERDFYDPAALTGYIPTETVESYVMRIEEGQNPKSGLRAWRITGDYGTGKSSFALLLANIVRGKEHPVPNHLKHLQKTFASEETSLGFLPVLATCSRVPLQNTILEAINRAIQQLCAQGKQILVNNKLADAVSGKVPLTDDELIELISDINSALIDSGLGRGVVLLIDELGKYLEFAASSSGKHDVFLLQRLAESAARSGSKPFFVVCILHQGFSAYSASLSQLAQREWEKVAGRFEEILFDQPIGQIINIIASALNINQEEIPLSIQNQMKQALKLTSESGWFGKTTLANLMPLAERIYPLHPTVLPVMVRFFRRYGQNERSIFSFLLSNEPFGIQAYSDNTLNNTSLYSLYHFYDYVRNNFGHRLASQSYRNHWSLIESVIDSYTTENESELRILKTVGILNLLDDTDLLPSEELVKCATDYSDEKIVATSLVRLKQEKKTLYNRGVSRGLCLWPHTSVDLEKSMGEARKAVDTPTRIAPYISCRLSKRPIVARRHYIETGNLRFFEICYLPADELNSILNTPKDIVNGKIIIPLCESDEDLAIASDFAKKSELKSYPTYIMAIPFQTLNCLDKLVAEAMRWDWISEHTPDLCTDRYAFEEVSRQKETIEQQLNNRLQSMLGLMQQNETSKLSWSYCGLPLNIKNSRDFLSELSSIFDKVFPDAPHINNELLNRNSLSSTAAAARMRLLERMLTDADKPFLGMDLNKKPPEMSMYLSVLKNTNIHQEYKGNWCLREPLSDSDKCHFLPAMQRINSILTETYDKRVNVAFIFNSLRCAPYGIRDGVLPVLLTAYAVAHSENVAFYKEGTYIPEFDRNMMLVLTKNPEKFEIQFCVIEGIRSDIFGKMFSVLEMTRITDRKVELLDVVKPLCEFVAKLPPYVRSTMNLSKTSLAVRDAILNAQEPVKLLFSDLPKSCGFQMFDNHPNDESLLKSYILTLKSSIEEMRGSFERLQNFVRDEINEAFDLVGEDQECRSEIAKRAEKIVSTVKENRLKPLCIRLMDDNLPSADWLNSIGSLLSNKPLINWRDVEKDLFVTELASMSEKFKRVESIVFAKENISDSVNGIRLSLTLANGCETERVFHYRTNDEKSISELQEKFENLLKNGKKHALIAASRAILSVLNKENQDE